MEFDWDDAKHQRNLRERAFGFGFASRVFQGAVVEWIDDRVDYGETRIRAVGEVEGPHPPRRLYPARRRALDHLRPDGEQERTQKMARRTLNEILSAEADVDRAKLRATTETDVRRHMMEDGQDPDEELSDSYELAVPPQIVREKLGMTQEQFAKALRIPVGTLRNWEQRRVGLDPAVRSLLTIAYAMPDALRVLTPAGRRTLAAGHSAGTIASRGRR